MSNTDFTDTVQAKSDQMNAIDFMSGPQTYKVISAVKTNDPKQPIAITVEGNKQPYKPSLGYRRILTAVWGMDGKKWAGMSLTLDLDETVVYGGKEVGGICITAMQGIETKSRFKVAINRTKHKFVTIFGISSAPEIARAINKINPIYDDAAFAKTLPKVMLHISDGKMTPEQAIAQLEKTAQLTDAQKLQITQPVKEV